MELTLVEKKMLNALRIVQEYLTPQRLIKRVEYSVLMDTVELAIRAGVNKQLDCPSGLHASDCLCTEKKEGITFHYAKYKNHINLRRENKK